VCVCGIPNVIIMEMYYAVPCKACSITEEYTAAEEQISNPLSKE
jgi:predicted nucleic-acid-binding Zn-ribbon protein